MISGMPSLHWSVGGAYSPFGFLPLVCLWIWSPEQARGGRMGRPCGHVSMCGWLCWERGVTWIAWPGGIGGQKQCPPRRPHTSSPQLPSLLEDSPALLCPLHPPQSTQESTARLPSLMWAFKQRDHDWFLSGSLTCNLWPQEASVRVCWGHDERVNEWMVLSSVACCFLPWPQRGLLSLS